MAYDQTVLFLQSIIQVLSQNSQNDNHDLRESARCFRNWFCVMQKHNKQKAI